MILPLLKIDLDVLFQVQFSATRLGYKVIRKMATLCVALCDSSWCLIQHGLRAKGQVGFCKDYHTTDQLFILRTLIE